MKTTQLYIEQVIIGFLIIVIVLFPWLPEAITKFEPIKSSFSGFAAVGSAALGIAFFLGIPFDRLADTLTERLDHAQRLAVAFVRAPKIATGTDPYPEDELLLKCLTKQNGITARMDYLRSRIRLSRALAVYGPALTATSTFGAARYHQIVPADYLKWLILLFLAIAAAYTVWTLAIIRFAKELPRTDDVAFVAAAKNRDLVPLCRWTVTARGKISDFSIWRSEAKFYAPAALLIIGVLLSTSCDAVADRGHGLFLVALGGIVLTTISAWSWWRTSNTYRKFLLDAGKL